jgi:ubiquinone/menaquinone biosynthesis C-methylase UbiE
MAEERPTDPIPSYALGHSNREVERLSAQARLLEPLTREFLRQAGVVPGMRVLDVGSGAGDVTFLAAELVGNTGTVIGTDRAAGALAIARARAEARSLHNVSFVEGDPSEMTFDETFDAVVGRFVLMFQATPAVMLRLLARHLRPGGILAFHEPDWDGARSVPTLPTYDQCCRWIVETFRSLGTDTRMGTKLYSAFVAAGLPAPTLRLQAIAGGGVGGGTGGLDWLQVVAEIVSTLLPEMERRGVANAADAGIETLARRLSAELAAGGGIVVAPSLIGAWSRV